LREGLAHVRRAGYHPDVDPPQTTPLSGDLITPPENEFEDLDDAVEWGLGSAAVPDLSLHEGLESSVEAALAIDDFTVLADIPGDEPEPSFSRFPEIADPSDDSIADFLRSAQQVALLDEATEGVLGERIEVGVLAAERLDSISEDGLRSRASRELRWLVRDGERARELMIRSNLRLVVHMARRIAPSAMSLADRVQEGNIGLIRAVEKFDHQLGFRFSTYATWWVRQAIFRAVANQSRVIRLPVHIWDILAKLRQIERRMERGQEEPGPAKVAEELDVSVERYAQLLALRAEPISLEDLVSRSEHLANISALIEEDLPLEPLRFNADLRDPRSPEIDDDISAEMLAHRLDAVLNSLSEREALVIRMRFGLYDGDRWTLEQIGGSFGVTRERARQIEGKAMEKLRHPSRRLGLSDFR
jgi:RNA polymerase primary sigma factor